MEYGGIVEESKWDMHLKMPKDVTPHTLIFKPESDASKMKQFLEENDLQLPLILKPERGMRGKGIDKIDCLEDLTNYKPEKRFTYLIQEFKDFPLEIGLFAYKHPKTQNWEVSSIMERGFPKVIGDGKSTLEQLVRKDSRTFLQLKRWKKSIYFKGDLILKKGEEYILDKIGNHRLGTKFIDCQDKLSPELEEAIGKLCERIEGLEYGRLDICFNSWEELIQLKNFSVIEINGANSEPAHIYDPRHSLLFAWKSLYHHFRIQYLIALNAKKRGEKPLTHKEAAKIIGAYNKTMTGLD
jgi:hypothetical protein